MKAPVSLLETKLSRVGRNSRFTVSELAEQGFAYAFLALIGFFCGQGVVPGQYTPFGAAAVAGCPVATLPAILIGAALGSLTAGVGGVFRSLAVLLCVVALRLITQPLKISGHSLFPSLIALISDAGISAATLHGLPGGILFGLSEGLMAAGGAYFVRRAGIVVGQKKNGLDTQEMTSVVLCLGMVWLGLFRYAPFGIPFGHTPAVLILLIAARYGHTAAGCVWGVVCGVIASQTGSPRGLCLAFGFAGMMAGLFAETGKIGELLGFTGAVILSVWPEFSSAAFLGPLLAWGLGAVCFAALPKTVLTRFAGLFSGQMALVKPDGLIRGLTMRLRFAAGALTDVSETVDQVATKLAAVNAPDFHRVLEQIEADGCAGCTLRRLCWESRHDATVEEILCMTKAVKQGHPRPAEACDEEFKGRCLHSAQLAEATRRHYTDYMARFAAEQRVEEVRGVVADQFAGIAEMLRALALDYQTDERFDSLSAAKAGKALSDLHLMPKECGVRLDAQNRMTVEVRLPTDSDTVLNKAAVMQALCTALDRTFDPPCTTVLGKDTFLCISEHACYTADIGTYQISSSDGAVCGDACEHFFDGKGNLMLLLSDGMGTGGRAAVDAACATGLLSRLLKAGFGYDAALKILNASMLFKSTDESCASVDLVVIDLVSGKTRLLKAGAAPTLVRRGGRVGKAQSTSLPAGILRGIGFDKALITLNKGDAILLLSDGAVSEGTEWIAEELESFRDGSAKELARKIACSARRRRTDAHRDDITVLAAILEEAP